MSASPLALNATDDDDDVDAASPASPRAASTSTALTSSLSAPAHAAKSTCTTPIPTARLDSASPADAAFAPSTVAVPAHPHTTANNSAHATPSPTSLTPHPLDPSSTSTQCSHRPLNAPPLVNARAQSNAAHLCRAFPPIIASLHASAASRARSYAEYSPFARSAFVSYALSASKSARVSTLVVTPCRAKNEISSLILRSAGSLTARTCEVSNGALDIVG